MASASPVRDSRGAVELSDSRLRSRVQARRCRDEVVEQIDLRASDPAGVPPPHHSLDGFPEEPRLEGVLQADPIRLGRRRSRGSRRRRRSLPKPGFEPGEYRMFVCRPCRRPALRLECAAARANRPVAEVAEEVEHRHRAAGGERAFQGDHPLRGPFAGRPGGVRSLGEQHLARATLEVTQRNVAEIPRIPLA